MQGVQPTSVVNYSHDNTCPARLHVIEIMAVEKLVPRIVHDHIGLIDELDDFGRAAGFAVETGYDGIHLAGANMGIMQQFLSPFYNRRDDEFGGSLEGRSRFFEVLYDKIRERIGSDVPLITKIPVETAAPWFVRRHLSLSDGIRIAQRLEEIGFDAVVPVQGSVFWEMSLIRGAYPKRAWNGADFQAWYEAAFGSRFRVRVVASLNWLQAQTYTFEPAWNSPFVIRVKGVVSILVLAEGGIRS